MNKPYNNKFNSRVHILLRNRCVHFRPGRAKVFFACSSTFFVCIVCFLVDFRKKIEAVVGPEKFNLRQSLAANNVTPTPPWTQMNPKKVTSWFMKLHELL